MKNFKKILSIIWIIIFIHFLKDITQDILKIPTFLDYFGNIQEDLSNLPYIIKESIIIAGYMSFFGEIFLLISIPTIQRRTTFSKLEKWVVGTIIFMLIYFPTVLFLDSRF